MRQPRNYEADSASAKVERAAWMLDLVIEMLDGENLLSDWHRARMESLAVDARASARIQAVIDEQRSRPVRRPSPRRSSQVIPLANGGQVVAVRVAS